MTDTKPLAWLPFEPDLLDAAPDSLRYEVFVPEEGVEPPASISDVEFYVPPYSFSARDGGVLQDMSSLKVVQTMSAGVDHLRSYVPAGVTLCRGAGVHDASTAELALALILASLRGLPGFVRAQDRAEWRPQRTTSLADRTVLIVGYGSVGAAIERRLEGFEVDVLRGPVVDTGALVAELEQGRIRAAVDVTDPEPLPSDHPLWRVPGLLILPHVGGASSAMWPRAHRLVQEQLERFSAGEPLRYVVSGEY